MKPVPSRQVAAVAVAVDIVAVAAVEAIGAIARAGFNRWPESISERQRRILAGNGSSVC
jgi:hypothetical protein